MERPRAQKLVLILTTLKEGTCLEGMIGKDVRGRFSRWNRRSLNVCRRRPEVGNDEG
jgi:hypothetical protein